MDHANTDVVTIRTVLARDHAGPNSMCSHSMAFTRPGLSTSAKLQGAPEGVGYGWISKEYGARTAGKSLH